MKNAVQFFFLLCFGLTACGQDATNQNNNTISLQENSTYSTEMVIPDINIPWGMDFLPDGSFLVTEKSGSLLHFKDGVKTMISGVPPVYDRGQGGLLDVKLHPDFETNHWIYMTYASEDGEERGGNTALMRAQLNDTILTNSEILYKAVPNTTKGQHFGSRIVFDKENHIYFSIGERGNRDVNPQDITRDGGKIYRLNADGSIPNDNPFVDQQDAKKAIWSYGHRNPQGMIVHPITGEIWVHEHGPQGGDEINLIKKGANYGWPIITYGINYSGTPITDETARPGMEQPLYYWVPSIAPSGMEYVTSDKFPELKNVILVGSLKFGYVEAVYFEGTKPVKREKILQDIGRVRNIKQGPDGNIYISVEGKGILKLTK